MKKFAESNRIVHLSHLLFLVAIGMSFKFSRSVSADQYARNQAQAQESLLNQVQESQELLERKDTDSIIEMRKILERVLAPVG